MRVIDQLRNTGANARFVLPVLDALIYEETLSWYTAALSVGLTGPPCKHECQGPSHGWHLRPEIP